MTSENECPYKVEPRIGLSEHITITDAFSLLLDYLDTEPEYLNAPIELKVKRLQSLLEVGVFGLIAYFFERGYTQAKADK